MPVLQRFKASYLILTCLLMAGTEKTFALTDYELIIANVTAQLKTGVNTSSLNSTVATLVGNLTAAGTWSDITYSGGDVPYNTHITRIKTMALAYSHSGSSYYNSAALLDKIVLALRYWNQTMYDASNWWYDQIGNPQPMGEALILMRGGTPGLPQTVEDSAINYMVVRGGNPSLQTGANRVDVAIHWVYRGALTTNASVVSSGVTQAFSTLALVNNGSEGLNYDYAFLQHGPELQTQSYGIDFIAGIYEVGLYIAGTSYGMSSDQLYKAFVFLHNSIYGASRGHYKDFNLQGRSISRSGNNGGLSATWAAQAMRVDTGHAATLRNDSLRASGVQPVSYNVSTPYHIHYRTGDYTLHNRPGYAFSVLGVSTRTYRSESINGENLLGKFLNEGATGIRVSGNEYYNIFPVWDWNKVPGITMREFATPQQNASGVYGGTGFVGGVSDSSYGASVYQQNYVGVTAKKAWFFFDNEVVCLGAGITSTQAENIATSVNQCLLNGAAVSVKSNGTVSTLAAQTQAAYNNNLQWVFHNKIGYFFPAGGNIAVSNKTQTGNWYTINSTQTNATVSMDVFNMSVSHGAQPTNAAYAYIVAPGIANTTAMDAYDTTAVRIISNTGTVQAVKHNGLKMLQIIFHAAGTIVDSSAHLKITVNNPCALLIKNADSSRLTVSIADPTQLLTGITLTVNFSYTGISHITNITLPSGNAKGASAKVVVDSTVLPTPAGDLYPAIEDAYVRDGAAYNSINYGTVTGLPVKNDGVGYTRQAYFKFDPRLQARPVSKATLRLYSTGGNTGANTTQWALYKTTSGSWTENGITWNNKPAALNQVAVHDGQVAAGYVDWDITTALNSLPADSLLSFQLVSTMTGATTDASFSAREVTDSARRPVITIDNTPPSKDSVLTIADAYVRDGSSYAGSNFGGATGLVVKNDPAAGYSRETYLKFNLNTLKARLVKATLRLYGSGNTTANTMQWKLHAVDDDTWTETGITWSNKPAAGALTDSIAGKAGAAYSEWDITSLVKSLNGDSIVSFKLIATGTGGGTTDVTFYSKETSTPAWRPFVLLYNDTTPDAGSRITVNGPQVTPADSIATGADITVFPNPAVSTCTIRSSELIKSVIVYNAAGRVMKTIAGLHTYRYEMNMSGWTNGIYFFSVHGDKRILAREKILKAE